jgi:Zn-dependent protease
MSKKTKIYTSFHELSPSEYMYFPKGSLDIGSLGKFSSTEIIHLLISIIVLTLAFSFVFSKSSLVYNFNNIYSLPYAIPISFLGIITAFFFHELSHKFVAQKFGLWSEFRMYPKGLLLSLFFAIITGFVFAAPGAVMFRGTTKIQEIGKIAVAGPLANIIISAITYVLYRFIFFETPLIGRLLGFIALINALLGMFNLLPFGPLDGTKVIRWNGIVWAILFIISIVFVFLIFQIATYV